MDRLVNSGIFKHLMDKNMVKNLAQTGEVFEDRGILNKTERLPLKHVVVMFMIHGVGLGICLIVFLLEKMLKKET